MKSGIAKGLLVTALQLMIVGSLAAKYAHDRATCPRVWVKIAYYDPDLPIRGRYAEVSIELDQPGLFAEKPRVEDHRYETPAELAEETRKRGAQNPPKPRYFPIWESKPVRLEVHNGRLVAVDDEKSNVLASYSRDVDGHARVFIQDPIEFFVPENATNLPGWRWPRDAHTEWWAEVTIPKKGPPRPIRLGIKKPEGQIMPLPVN